MILLACSALGLAGAVWPGRRRAGPSRSSILALGAGCVVLGAIGLLEHRNARVVKTRWEASARDRLEDRAHTIEEDFRRFLEELSAPLSPARASVEDRSAAFATLARAHASSRLPTDRLGFSIYRADLSLLAWDGNSSAAPRALLAAPCPGPAYAIGGREASRRIFAAACSPDGSRWVTEFVLEPPEEGEARETTPSRLAFLPRWEGAGPASVRFREDPSGQDDLSRLFQRQGDRHWGRLAGEGVLTLAFPLRSPSGERLAIVSLHDRRATQEIGDRRRLLRLFGGLAAALAIFCAWGLPLRAG